MYSTNINHQQGGRQAPNTKPAPNGGHYVLHIEDVVTDDGKLGLAIYGDTLQEPDHETPAYLVALLLERVITSNSDAIGGVMVDTINRNREGKQEVNHHD